MRYLSVLVLATMLATPCAAAVPPPLIETMNYAFVPDAHFVWHGPEAASGVLVWAHGKSGKGWDERDVPAPPYVRLFNDAGWDIVRFNRAPLPDDVNRASGWLHDGLRRVRAMGWRAVIAAGQSRGAWNDLQLLDTPGLADTIIAVSPAAQGFGESLELNGQTDQLRAMLADLPRQSTRVAFVQFSGDFFIGSADARRNLMERLAGPNVGALLMIDRPAGLTGHGAANGADFAQAYGACLLAFATAAVPPATCPPGPVSNAAGKAAGNAAGNSAASR